MRYFYLFSNYVDNFLSSWHKSMKVCGRQIVFDRFLTTTGVCLLVEKVMFGWFFDRGIHIALTSKYMNKRNSTHLDHIFIWKIVFKYDDKLLKGENNQHTYKKYNWRPFVEYIRPVKGVWRLSNSGKELFLHNFCLLN